MSVGPGSALGDVRADSVRIACSAVVSGTARLGEGSLLAQGAVIRSHGTSVDIGTGSAVLENSVVVGTARIPTIIGRRSVFGHRCMVIGAFVGDLCEVGNASILMPGARLGDRVFLGEGTLVPAGTTLPNEVVAVGRPARVVRSASDDDLRRLVALRDGDLSLPVADGGHHRTDTGARCDGPSVRVPRHPADHRRVGDPASHSGSHGRRGRR